MILIVSDHNELKGVDQNKYDSIIYVSEYNFSVVKGEHFGYEYRAATSFKYFGNFLKKYYQYRKNMDALSYEI